MKKHISFLQGAFRKFDLFPATQFLRYKEEGDYKTATGGFVSIAINVIFVILFYNLGTQTINREIINGSISYNIEVEPQPLTIKFAENSDFMFSVGIGGFNLSDPSIKYFNITLKQHFYSPIMKDINTITVSLVPCTPQHFSYNSDILNFYHQFNLSRNLCPPLDYQFTVGGRVTSQIFSTFSVYVSYCNKTIDERCISDIQLQKIQKMAGGFVVYVPIISTIVNAGDAQYKQVYIEDRNTFYFTTTLGLQLIGQVQMYQIDTDVSLMPYTSIQTQYPTTIPNLFMAKSKIVFNDCYVQVKFTKSNVSTVFTRSFNKLDNYFSYVGGLVGTILLFFYLLNNYSEVSYTIDIAQQIYSFQLDSPPGLKCFHFFYYIAICVKKIFACVRVELEWEQVSKFIGATEEMEKQLNVSYLLKRINYFQDALTSILTQHQILTLYLSGKKSIEEAAASRKQSQLSKDAFEIKLSEDNGTELSGGEHLNQNHLQQDYFSKTSPVPLKKIPKQTKRQVNEQQPKSQVCEQIKKSGLIEKVKQSLIQVIRQSNEGNQISSRIMSKVSKILPEMGISESNKHPHDEDNQFAVSNEYKERKQTSKRYNLQLEQIP